MPRTATESQLSEYLYESQFDFIPHGRISLQNIYQAVQNHVPHLCNDELLCNCGREHSSPEWKHVVRSVLDNLKAKELSRVSKLEKGYWHFGEIIEL